ncbi:MAG TPA: tetratricopeptide repeat protein, partial [Thermoanaerobaculia bacterium]|nr:tetratricopeptide repeat protein [Thermoanaerobaculia bacterium]
SAGYATGAFVAGFPLDAGYGLNQGFDVYDDRFPRGAQPDAFFMPQRRGDQVVAPALQWWRANEAKKRFLWVHLYDPHSPYQPAEPFKSRFPRNPYLGEVAASDAYLAPLLDPLLAGKGKPTLVVVTADHGESLGEHGEKTHGLFAYEATLHVPLVVWGPGIAPGRDERSARHVDIVPTVLQALRLPVPAGLPGSLLLAAAPADKGSYFESLSTCLNRGWAPLRGMLRDQKKLIELPIPELYDLASDAREANNRFADDRRTARDLAARLPSESVWPPERRDLGSEEEAQLRNLGYAAGSAPRKAAYTAADDPKNLVELDDQLHAMLDLYAMGRYEETIALGDRVLAKRPDTVEAVERVSLALRHLDRPGEAITRLRQALVRMPDREALRRQLGMALSEEGRSAEAVEVMQPVASTHEVESLDVLGAALSEVGRAQEAETVLRRAIALHPSDPRPYENLGIALLRADRVNEAVAELERALGMEDRLVVSWNTLGVARYRLGDVPGAIRAWQRATELDPTLYDALFNLGLVAAQAGRPGEARAALERFVQTAPAGQYAPDIAKARAVLSRIAG